MLRERYSKAEFEKIFYLFNEAVYRGEVQKLNYKSWRTIKNWLLDEKYPQMEVSKEWVRIRDDDSDNNPYAYHDEERIFVGPYAYAICCPSPEELDPNDNSLGSWLDGVLVRESPMTLNSTSSDMNKVAYAGATVCNAMADVGEAASTMSDALKQIQSNVYTLNDMSDVCYYSIGTDWINTSPPRYELKSDNLYIDGKPFNEYLQAFTDTEKESNKMMKFDFGPVDSSVHMSMYGMAIKNASGTYVAYDKNTGNVIDVDIVNFEGANKFMYKVPVALKSVSCGDVVIHARKPMFVQAAYADGRFKVLDIFDGEEKTIVPSRSPFGFDFMTKIVSFVDFGNATSSNPFGNMLPFLLMNDSKSKDNDMLLMMALAGGNIDFASNPMLMYALMSKDNKSNDMLPLLMMSGMFNKPTCTCACGCHESE